MLSTIDKSNYLKGLFVLAKRNQKLHEGEKTVIRGAAKRLGFSEDFYEEILRSLLENKYISELPIKFSDKETAKQFIQEGIVLAFSDNELSNDELDWLYQTAIINELPTMFVDEVKKNYLKSIEKVNTRA